MSGRGLPTVIDAVITDFAASSVPCAILYGPDHMAEHGAPPRIVVTPVGDTYGPANYVQNSDWPAGTMADGQNPRTILTRYEGARATLWAEGASLQSDPLLKPRADYDALHELINQFILSLHRVNPGNYLVQRGETTETTRATRFGYVYTLYFSVQSPIIDTPWPTATGVSQVSTVTMQFPDGQHEDVIIQDP